MTGITPITLPKWGLEMSEGTVTGWHLAEGDSAEKGAELVDVETDKIVKVVELDQAGTLRRIVVPEGETVPVGTLIAVFADASVDDAAIDGFIADYKPVDASFEPGADAPAAPAKPEAPAPRSGDALLDVFFDAAAGGRSSAANPRPAATSGRAPQSDAKLNTLLDSLYSPATSVVDKELKSAPAAARVSEPQISDLVSELAWVRNRLMGFRGESEGDKLNKALAYLDLVTQDMERWLQRHQSGGQ